MDISLPSTRASTPWAGDKSGNGGLYLTPKVETLERAQAEGAYALTLPTAVTEGADTPLEAAFVIDFIRYVIMLRFTLVTSDGKRYPWEYLKGPKYVDNKQTEAYNSHSA